VGARVSHQCFSDVDEARALIYSGTLPTVLPSGDLQTIEFSGGDWVVQTYSGGVLVDSSTAPSLSLYPCDKTAELADAAALAWLVVLVWAAAWGVAVLRRAVFL